LRSAAFPVLPFLIDQMISFRRPESKFPCEIITKLFNFPVSTAFKVTHDWQKAFEVMEDLDGKSQLFAGLHSALIRTEEPDLLESLSQQQ
jgi:hypothetical protein